MIPTGLRVRPQFYDVLQQIALHPYIPRYPNRDAKRLRNGFVFSKYDEDNLVLADQQQLNVINVQSRHDMILQAAMKAGIPPTSMDTSGFAPIHEPITAEIGGMTEEQRLQHLADRLEEERKQEFEAQQKLMKAAGMVQGLFRGVSVRNKLMELDPTMAPPWPELLSADSDDIVSLMKKTHWRTPSNPDTMTYKVIGSMVMKYNQKVPVQDKIEVIRPQKKESLLIAKNIMLRQLREKFASIQMRGTGISSSSA